jgi:hypothetical protein
MKLYVLFGQRHCRYEGEYAPEALAVIDEYGDEDNPEYMQEQLATNQASKDFAFLRVIALDVNGAKITELLSPETPVVPAVVTG